MHHDTQQAMTKGKRKKTTITMELDLIAALDSAATESGTNLSEMVRRCCALFLSKGATHPHASRTALRRALFAERCNAPLAEGTKGGWPRERKMSGGAAVDLDTIREIQRLMDGSRGAAPGAPANEKKIARLLGIAGESEREKELVGAVDPNRPSSKTPRTAGRLRATAPTGRKPAACVASEGGPR